VPVVPDPTTSKQLEELRAAVKSIQKTQAASAKALTDIRGELQLIRKSTEVLRLEATCATLDDVQRFTSMRQLGFLATVEHLAATGCSFARFGDGEARLMLRPEFRITFQRNSPQLSADLRDVLSLAEANNPNLLIGFPHAYRDLHWSGVWANVWSQLKPLVEPLQQVGNSHVSRPIFFELLGEEGVSAWRSVWAGQAVTVVTGQGSRFEPIPELFDNVQDISFEHSVPVDAHADLERLLHQLDSSRADLHLIALGPAGTVLAARLAARGQRAIDIGHISDSYQTAFEGAPWPENKPSVR
jgi:hypothetical protein